VFPSGDADERAGAPFVQAFTEAIVNLAQPTTATQ